VRTANINVEVEGYILNLEACSTKVFNIAVYFFSTCVSSN